MRNRVARRANSFWVSAVVALEVVRGEELGQPTIEEDSRGQARRVVGRPAPPLEARCAQPGGELHQATSSDSTRNETMKPLTLTNEARFWKSKSRANPFFDQLPERGVALAHVRIADFIGV